MKKRFFLIMVGMIVFISNNSLAADTNWTNNAGTQDWGTTPNWSSGVPTSGATVGINGTGTAGCIIGSGVSAATGWIQLGDTAGQSGELTIEGTGRLDVSGVWVMVGTFSDGKITLRDTSFMNNGTLLLGYAASGILNMSDDSGYYGINVTLGEAAGGVGTLNMTGGFMNVVNQFYVGWQGSGQANLWGGTLTSRIFGIGNGTMDVRNDGVFRVNGDVVNAFTGTGGYVDQGKVTAYGGEGAIRAVFDGIYTTVTSVPNPGRLNISVPTQSPRTMHFAAEELSKYFNTMTGSDYNIINEDENDANNLLRLQVDPGLSHDGYRIGCSGGSIIISGGSPRGCLYGVYTLLKEFGCRWPLPGKAYEVVPRIHDISWNCPPIESQPAVGNRGFMSIFLDWDKEQIYDLIDYLCKNRINFFYNFDWSPPSDEILVHLKETLADRDMGFEWGGHILNKYLPRSLFAEHPEYFRMVSGERNPAINFCPSSEGALDVIATSATLEFNKFNEFERFETFQLYADDLDGSDGGWCQCKLCFGLSPSDQALKAINGLATRMSLGETKLVHLAYHNTINAPATIIPEDNVQLLFAARERCYKHSIGEKSCPTNQRYLGLLKDNISWMPDDPYVFEYYLDLILYRCLPMPLHKIIGDDVKAYREAGIDRMVAHCFQTFSDWAYGLNYYIFANSMWRGQGSPEDIQNFCEAVYGPQAAVMEEYYDRIAELCSVAIQTCGYEGFADMRVPPLQEWTPVHIAQLTPLMSDENLNSIENLITSAITAAKEPYKSRISNQLILWNFARLETKAIYETMVAKYEFSRLTAESSKQERSYVQEVATQALEHASAASQIVVSVPIYLRGPHVYENSPAMSVGFVYNDLAYIINHLSGTDWTNSTGNRNWNTASNWDTAEVPVSVSNVRIGLTGTMGSVIGNSVIAEAGNVRIGCPAGAPGNLTISGDGRLTLSGDGAVRIGEVTEGVLNIQDAANLNVANYVMIGDAASGTMNMSGGTYWSHGITICEQPGSSGTLNMTGGELTVNNQLYVGWKGLGQINLWGGTITAGTFGVGNGNVDIRNNGTLRISGNVVDTITEIGGYADQGKVTAYGGVLDVQAVFDGIYTTVTSTGVFICPPLFEQGDLNGDCVVNLHDLAIIANNWLRCGWNIKELCP